MRFTRKIAECVFMYGGESGTRTLKPLRTNGFQDRATTNYHNSPYLVGDEGIAPTRDKVSGFTDPRAYFNALIPDIMYGRGGRTRTYDGQLTSVLETDAIATMRHPYICGGG